MICRGCLVDFDPTPSQVQSRGLCRDCNAEKSRSRRSRDPERDRAYRRAYRAKNKEAVNIKRAAYTYGLPEADVVRLRSVRTCDLCEKELEVACIDHCHRTGRVRGVLCSVCNVFLGKLEKRRSALAKYLAYLDGKIETSIAKMRGR